MLSLSLHELVDLSSLVAQENPTTASVDLLASLLEYYEALTKELHPANDVFREVLDQANSGLTNNVCTQYKSYSQGISYPE